MNRSGDHPGIRVVIQPSRPGDYERYPARKKRNTVQIRYLIFLAVVSLLALSYLFNASAARENASARTALMYVRDCEKRLGPFPKFHYEDAIEIPITQNGKRVIVTVENIGKNLKSCEKPAAFGAPCQQGNRVGR